MIDFSAGVELMFADVSSDINERILAAAESGFPAVEIWMWSDKDLGRLESVLGQAKVRLETMCIEPFVNLADAHAHGSLRAGARESALRAEALGCEKLVMQVRKRVPGVPYDDQRRAVVEGIRAVAEEIAPYGVSVLIEIVNDRFEGPDNFLLSTPEAVAILDEVARPNAKLLFDRFHTYVNGEPRGLGIEGRIELVGHVQSADSPGRHEFGTGEMNWHDELAWLIGQGYQGFVGIEATPIGPSADVYGKAKALLSTARDSAVDD